MHSIRRYLTELPLLLLFVGGLLFMAHSAGSQVGAVAFPVGAAALRRWRQRRHAAGTDRDGRDPALAWLVLPAVLLGASLLEVRWDQGLDLTQGVTLGAFLATALAAPQWCAGWWSPVRWLATSAALVLPAWLSSGELAPGALLAAFRLAILADFIRTGLFRGDVRPDRLLAAVGLGVVIALQQDLFWLPVAVLAAATAELTAHGAFSPEVWAVRPAHARPRRWLARGSFVACFVVTALACTWSVYQLAPFGRQIHEVGPVAVSAVSRFAVESFRTRKSAAVQEFPPSHPSDPLEAKPDVAPDQSTEKPGQPLLSAKPVDTTSAAERAFAPAPDSTPRSGATTAVPYPRSGAGQNPAVDSHASSEPQNSLPSGDKPAAPSASRPERAASSRTPPTPAATGLSATDETSPQTRIVRTAVEAGRRLSSSENETFTRSATTPGGRVRSGDETSEPRATPGASPSGDSRTPPTTTADASNAASILLPASVLVTPERVSSAPGDARFSEAAPGSAIAFQPPFLAVPSLPAPPIPALASSGQRSPSPAKDAASRQDEPGFDSVSAMVDSPSGANANGSVKLPAAHRSRSSLSGPRPAGTEFPEEAPVLLRTPDLVAGVADPGLSARILANTEPTSARPATASQGMSGGIDPGVPAAVASHIGNNPPVPMSLILDTAGTTVELSPSNPMDANDTPSRGRDQSSTIHNPNTIVAASASPPSTGQAASKRAPPSVAKTSLGQLDQAAGSPGPRPADDSSRTTTPSTAAATTNRAAGAPAANSTSEAPPGPAQPPGDATGVTGVKFVMPEPTNARENTSASASSVLKSGAPRAANARDGVAAADGSPSTPDATLRSGSTTAASDSRSGANSNGPAATRAPSQLPFSQRPASSTAAPDESRAQQEASSLKPSTLATPSSARATSGQPSPSPAKEVARDLTPPTSARGPSPKPAVEAPKADSTAKPAPPQEPAVATKPPEVEPAKEPKPPPPVPSPRFELPDFGLGRVLDSFAWPLQEALFAALALLAMLILVRRWRARTADARSPLGLEDRTQAGRCLWAIENLLARPAPPSVAGELTELHRLGLHLRYGLEFSRDQVMYLEREARRLQRAIDAFERGLGAGPGRRTPLQS